MSEPAAGQQSQQRPPFQFTIRTVLTIITGTSILLSLIVWEPGVGSAISVPIVGAWWTVAAVRAGQRRLAYYLASIVMGVIVYLVLASPISPFAYESFELIGRGTKRIDWLSIALMCAASLSTSAILRRWIRRPGNKYPVVMGLVGTYLGAALYGFFLLVFNIAWDSSSLIPYTGVVSATFVLIPVAAIIVGTTCIYFAGPVAVAFCFLLRWIDPAEPPPPGTA